MREASEAHVALSLVLDVSLSMGGAPINTLNTAVNEMVQQMKEDSRLKNIVDLAIFVFGDKGRNAIHQGFRAVADCDPVILQATDGSTYVTDALERAVEFSKKRCGAYDRAGGSYKPWVVLITDGEFNDDNMTLDRVGNSIKERESQGKLQFFALGVDKYNKSQIERLTNNPTQIIDAKVGNFGEFFSWIGRSMKAVSTKEVGEATPLPPLQFTV
jgi:uncharacterized protein YegL